MSMIWLHSRAAWIAVSWTMVHLLWVGGVIGLCGAAARSALRNARPETRYGAALACLIVLAAAPAVLFVQLLDRGEMLTPLAVQPSGTTVEGERLHEPLRRTLARASIWSCARSWASWSL